jgi:hypothetical protein
MNRTLETAVSAMLKQARSPEWYAEQERLFRDAIKPIQAMKVRLYSLYLPTIILDSEGNLVSAAYPDEMQKHIAELDKIIEGIAARTSKWAALLCQIGWHHWREGIGQKWCLRCRARRYWHNPDGWGGGWFK